MACCTSRGIGKGGMGYSSSPIWIEDIAATVRTGDILLFSSKHSTSNITKYWTSSRWDHIGIVVKPSPVRAYIVEWGGGLFACELVERLNEYAEWDALELVLRQLKLGPEQDRRVVEERIEQFIDMLFREKLGQNRGVPLGQVVKGALTGWKQSSSYSKKDIYADDLKELFCSKTVAVTYKAAGLLAPNRRSDKFTPKHFSVGQEGYLDFQGGASLGPEHRVTFESRRLKDAVYNVLNNPIIELVIDPLGTAVAQDKAAMIINRFVRRLAARRELRRRKAGGKVHEKDGLYKGAPKVTTRQRNDLLRRIVGEPRPRPQDTLQITWIDDDTPFEEGEKAPQE